MTWRDSLRPASFRGVPFFVDAADQQGGRRQAVHEFPQRDDVFVEDLGLRPHEFRIDGYVLGADYMAGRDAIIKAANEAGQGTLVHPYRGSLAVSCLEWTVRESDREGGVAWFTLTFIASATPDQPASAPDTGASVEAAATAADAEAVEGFPPLFSVDGLQGFVAEGAAARLSGVADVLEGGFSRLRGARDALSTASRQLQTLRADALALVRTAPDLAGAVFGLITSVRLLAATPATALSELLALIGYSSGDRAPGATPARLAERGNAAALERLVTISAAAEAGRAAREVTFESYDEAVAVRDAITGRLDQAAVALADVGDDAGYAVLNALRLTVVRDVTARGGSLARVYRHAPPATEPALVTAQRLYGDAGRATEIVERNRIRNTGFVPGGEPLEVLTDG